MAASITQNPPTKSDSKVSKKKKAKSETADISALTAPPMEPSPSNGVTESSDGSFESPYIKELYKNIRNVNKKLSNTAKVESILAENRGKALDELVSTRKINADQKAQILNKPALQASLIHLEEQIAQYKKFDQEYKAQALADKAELEKNFKEHADKELAEAVAVAKEEATSTQQKTIHDSLLLISQFLRLAAIRRGDEEADPALDENLALEGVLSKVYSGDETAVTAFMNILKGANETTSSVSGDPLTTTYADIKNAIHVSAPPSSELYDEPPTENNEYPIESDPTIATAGLTELDATAPEASNNHLEVNSESQGIPQNSGFGDGAANAAAEANWDNNNEMTGSGEWIEVPRPVTETETGLTATPAAASNVQSWADEQPEAPSQITPTPPANTNDGFHEVSRSRGGKDRGDSQFRSRGGRGGEGGYRGRGSFRGDGYRGRGRGGGRGNRGDGSYRGRGRPEEP